METLKYPKGFMKKGTAQFGVNDGAPFSGLTTLPIFQNEISNDSQSIIKLSNTQIKLLAGRKYRITNTLYSDGITGEYYSFYNVTAGVSLSNLGRGIFASLSAGAGLMIEFSPTVDTILECRADSAKGTSQSEFNTIIEEIENYLLPIPNVLNQMLGVNQNRIDVTASRVAGTTYTNTTGKPIQVIISLNTTFPGSRTLTINGVTVDSYTVASTWNGTMKLTGIVPPLGTYSTDASFTKWTELR